MVSGHWSTSACTHIQQLTNKWSLRWHLSFLSPCRSNIKSLAEFHWKFLRNCTESKTSKKYTFCVLTRNHRVWNCRNGEGQLLKQWQRGLPEECHDRFQHIVEMSSKEASNSGKTPYKLTPSMLESKNIAKTSQIHRFKANLWCFAVLFSKIDWHFL